MPRRTPRLERYAEEPTEDDVQDNARAIDDGLAAAHQAQAEEELSDLGVQLPEGAMGTLYRLLEGGDKEFIEEAPIAGWTVAHVAERYGGGRYMLYLKKPHPEHAGRWFKAGTKPFRITGPSRSGGIDSLNPQSIQPGPGIADVAALNRTYGDLIQSTIKTSLEQQNLMQSMQLALLKSMTERAPDPSMELFKAMVLKLLDRDAKGPTIADTIALADRLAQRGGPGVQLQETLDLIRVARDFGGGRDEPSWIPIAERALGLLDRAYTPKALSPGTLPDAIPNPTVETVPVPDHLHPLLHFLAPMVPVLIMHAGQDRDPDTYAGVICDQISDAHAGDVVTFLQSAGFATQLHEAFPATVPVAPWFAELTEQVVVRLRERLTPPSAPDEPVVDT